MKSRQKITRVQLNITSAEEFILLGIVTAEPDYKLSLSINRKLDISLKNSKPLEFNNENGTDLHFSVFSDTSKAPDLVYHLYSNKSGKEPLIKKFKKIDYFLLLHSPEEEFNPENIAAELRPIETITAVFVLNTGEIKDKNLHYLIP